MHVGGLHVEVRAVGRADPPLPEAHRPEAVQVPPVPALVLALGPPLIAHEAALSGVQQQQQQLPSARKMGAGLNISNRCAFDECDVKLTSSDVISAVIGPSGPWMDSSVTLCSLHRRVIHSLLLLLLLLTQRNDNKNALSLKLLKSFYTLTANCSLIFVYLPAGLSLS